MSNRAQPPWLNKLMIQNARQRVLKQTAFHTCLQLGILPEGRLLSPYLGTELGTNNSAAVAQWILDYYQPLPGIAHLPSISTCAADLEMVLRDRLPAALQGDIWHG